MSSKFDALVDTQPFKDPIFRKPSGKPMPEKRARFAQIAAFVIKYCYESGNPGLLGVLCYLAMNSHNPDWRYNVTGICNTIGLKRHCVTKWVKKLVEVGVLKPVENDGYAKCYILARCSTSRNRH